MRKHFLLIVLMQWLMIPAAYAVEVTPNIGFRHSYAPNGSEFDANSEYRMQSKQHSPYAMNEQMLGRNQLSKAIPEFNSVGLDFTFRVE